MNKLESQEFTHIMFIDSFSLIDESDSGFIFTRTGLCKPQNIICASLFSLLSLCVTVPWVIIVVTGLPGKYGVIRPFYDLEWWFWASLVFCCFSIVLCIVFQASQLMLLPFYSRIYNIANGSICVQEKNLFAVRTKNIKLDQNVRLEIKNDIEYKDKFPFMYPPLDNDFIKFYGKEFCINIYCNNKLKLIIDSLFQAEIEFFLQILKRNNEIQIENSQIGISDTQSTDANMNDCKEADKPITNEIDNIDNVVTNDKIKMTAALGVFDVCRFVFTWLILFHLMFLPQTIFEKSWTQQRLNKVLRKYYTDAEIESQNIYYVKTYDQLLLSNGIQLPSKELKYVHGYWLYLSIGVLAIVIVLDVLFGKRNINFIKWFLDEFNKPIQNKNLFKRKWRLTSAYRSNPKRKEVEVTE
jgi:hypothetical protein